MSAYHISTIHPSDRRAQRQVDVLLTQSGIQRDVHLDETIGIFDDDFQLVATGSLYANTLRCIAVDLAHQGEGIAGQLITALLERLMARGHQHVFLYTKPNAVRFFSELGFHEIARVPDRLVFMENRRGAFAKHLETLAHFRKDGKKTAAVVMNANPFTYGHQYLLELAAKQNDIVHCFVVSEDISLVPFDVRLALVKAGSADMLNVVIHPSGSYIVSSATFPSYFLKEERLITQTQAMLDIAIFTQIAQAMGISRRYIGEEPFSAITRIYNEAMLTQLPENGIECILVPRKEQAGSAISASGVRQLLHDGRIEAIESLVPPSTYAFFSSDEGRSVLLTIQNTEDVRHA